MIKINLMGQSAKARLRARREIEAVLYALAAIVAVAILARIWFSQHIAELAQKQESVSYEVAFVRTLANQVRNIEKQNKQAAENFALLENLSKAKRATLGVLDSIASSIPEQAWLTDFRERDEGIKLSGMARDGETISSFARALAKSSDLSEVKIEVAKQGTHEGLKLQEFSIRAQRVHRVPEPAKTETVNSKPKQGK
jgi:Tfp pilus assembly protein PilN